MASKEKNARQELLVGIFTAVSLIGLITMVFALNKTYLLASNSNYTVTFSFIDGLEKEAAVRYAGLTVGSVDSVEYVDADSTARMRVHFSMRDDVTLRTDARALINQSGMIGQKYIELLPFGDTETVIRPGEVFRGVDPLSMQQVFERIAAIGQDLQMTITGINSVVADKTVQEQIRGIVNNLGTAVDNGNALLVSLNAVTTENRGDVRNTIRNASAASNDLPALILDLRRTAAGIDAAAQGVRTLSNNLNGVTQDNRENIRKILANAEATSLSLKAFAADIEANPWKLLRTP